MAARADRNRRPRDRARWAWALGLLLVACARPPEQPPPALTTPALKELWADEHAMEGGDGSRGRPLRRLPASLPAGCTLHLATGLYRGPLHLSPGSLLESAGTAVVTASEGAVIDATDAELRGVSVQGGEVGVMAWGTVSLTRVHFSGHRRAGLRVEPGGRALVEDGLWEGVVGDARGVEVVGGSVEARGARFVGPFGRAVSCRGGGTLTLSRLWTEGAGTAVNAVDCTSTVSGTIGGGKGPALFFARGTATVQNVAVTGQEYAVQTRPGTRLTVQTLSSIGAQSGGLALMQTEAALEDLTLERTGPLGALTLLECGSRVKHLTVRDAQSLAVLVRQGKALFEDVQVQGVHSEEDHSLGDAVHVREAVVGLKHLEVRDTDGAALFVAAGARVKVGFLLSERSGAGALVVERGSEVKVDELTARASAAPAVAATEGGAIWVARLSVQGGADVPVWAECGGATRVEVTQLTSSTALPPSACVYVGARAQGWAP